MADDTQDGTLGTLERRLDDVAKEADRITGTPNTLQTGQRALYVMDAFPEEADRDVLWTGLLVLAQELIKLGKLEQKCNNGQDETVDKLLRIRGEVSESGTVRVAGLLKLLMPKRDIPEFLTKLVLDRQLGLGL